MAIFTPMTDYNNTYNNYRIYGAIVLIIMSIWVLLGVRFVSKFSPIALFCVMLSLLSIFIGIFVAREGAGPK